MVYVKICGITNLTDAIVATEAGADLLGFVFYRQSPRCLEPDQAGAIISALRDRGSTVRCVGVFVNETLERIRDVMQVSRLDLVQLHGNEPLILVHALSPRAYKALRPRDAREACATIKLYRRVVGQQEGIPHFIIDSFDARHFGGTGIRADWEIAALVAQAYRILLAGGLNAENVTNAIRAVNPWGVDVSSGVERAPGLKDPEKVKRFIRAAKSLH